MIFIFVTMFAIFNQIQHNARELLFTIIESVFTPITS
jgi:hypothetical protein